jgi:hypothetical protein
LPAETLKFLWAGVFGNNEGLGEKGVARRLKDRAQKEGSGRAAPKADNLSTPGDARREDAERIATMTLGVCIIEGHLLLDSNAGWFFNIHLLAFSGFLKPERF